MKMAMFARLKLHQTRTACTPGTPAPARKKRAAKQDLLERVERCEALLKQYAPVGGGISQEFDPSTHAPSASFTASSAQELNASYITTRGDGSVRFTDNFSTVMMHEEVSKAPCSSLDGLSVF
jgi:hypothetical protein